MFYFANLSFQRHTTMHKFKFYKQTPHLMSLKSFKHLDKLFEHRHLNKNIDTCLEIGTINVYRT